MLTRLLSSSMVVPVSSLPRLIVLPSMAIQLGTMELAARRTMLWSLSMAPAAYRNAAVGVACCARPRSLWGAVARRRGAMLLRGAVARRRGAGYSVGASAGSGCY